MLSGFGVNLSSESDYEAGAFEAKEDLRKRDDEKGNDIWLSERKVKIPKRGEWEWDEEGELGDSCCFGTRTVEVGLDCVWKLHGGV